MARVSAVSGAGAKKAAVAAHFDACAPRREGFRRRNAVYHHTLEAIVRAHVPEGKRVLQLGCGTGALLAAAKPSFGVGVDLSAGMLAEARRLHPEPHLAFVRGDAEALPLGGVFDYVIGCDLIGYLEDIERALEGLRAVCGPETRVLFSYFNFTWQPLLAAAEALGLKLPTLDQNWLGRGDIENLFALADYQLEDEGVRLLSPFSLGPLTSLVNDRLATAPGLRHLALVDYFVARPLPRAPVRPLSVSVVVPCRNEAGNIAEAVERTPEMGTGTELVFVDGSSTDGTVEEIERQIALHRGKRNLRLVHQVPPRDAGAAGTPDDLMLPAGKGDAVRKGFAAATGDVLMILDADLTVPPEELPKFFEAIARGKGRLANGTRLVYPLEDEAMKFFNMIGNRFFSVVFTWLLGQRIKDTLCGTKVLLREDYQLIASNRAYFGEFDPFGDFDLLFGASHANLPIVEVPVRYRRRSYGSTKVRLVRHGLILLRMSVIGFWKLKVQRWLGR